MHCYLFTRPVLLLCFVTAFLHTYSQISIPDSLVNSDEARRILSVLASDSLKGRFTGTGENKKAADFIVSEFKSAGLKTLAGYEDYLMPFNVWLKNKGNVSAYNVLAGLTGKTKPNETVIFSAHYDHIGTFSTNPSPSIHPAELRKKDDTIYNGANDDASGVTALILLAKYFVAKNNNERTLIFAAFSGEELGLLGSLALSDKVVPQQTIAVINIEMIGRSSQSKYHPFITGGELSNLQDILNKELEKKSVDSFGSYFFRDDPYTTQNLFFRSDNFSFARFGIPAHTIMLASGTDKYYHSVNDEIETINFDVMINTIRAIALSTEGIINGTDTPARIEKDRLYELKKAKANGF